MMPRSSMTLRSSTVSAFRATAVGLACLTTAPTTADAQTAPDTRSAHISEEARILDTYPFDEPNPVPILVRDPRLYPYHSFEGYSTTSEPREWKVVKLENEWIEVFVLPEVGGKVWGAVVKETGHEFIYRNEVMKFRNIALRGPWTSGGIEFNFGVIGHAPATATPVDYKLVENPDGSVSCWVGSMDLPSRTHWRVEIRLPADRAYFETNVLWYNPTPLEQPYYNWMTAAAFAQYDLEMAMPGSAYLRHSGQVEDWPIDGEGRYLPAYANNTFGGAKSYHVVGEIHDFFGGYFHDDDFGFGHWARHEDMPGQKLWLWALSREGGVWEDLLTDTDGQYVEFQAGRLFVQYSPGSHVNPITEARFDPMSASRWSETWFPVEGIGGLTEASRDGAMFVSEEGGRLTIGVNAFLDVADTLRVWSGGEPVLVEPVTLETLVSFETDVDVDAGADFRVQLPGLGLDFTSDPSRRRLSRPFATDEGAWPTIPGLDRRVFEANELMKGRRYALARNIFEEVVEAEPWNREALLGLGELAYRRGLFADGLDQVKRVLQLDAYDAEANFLAGLLYRALVRPSDAKDAFGWAARAIAFRSAAYVQLAELKIIEAQPLGWWRLAERARAGGADVDPEVFRKASAGGAHLSPLAWAEAIRYARLAIDSDRYSVPAWQALATIGRRTDDTELVAEARAELLALDPLHHFVAAEEYLEAPGGGAREAAARKAMEALGGEYPDQAILELAIRFGNLSLYRDALLLLNLGAAAGFGEGPVQRAWGAMMDNGPARLTDPPPPDFAFPYRAESLPVLRWTAENSDDWIWDYLLALNLWALDREDEAAEIMNRLGQVPDFAREPDFAPAWVARALLLEKVHDTPPSPDLQRAVEGDPETRILHLFLIRALEAAGRWEAALGALDRATERFSNADDFDLDLLRAKALINLGRPVEAAEILTSTHVLPSEGARESHRLWEQAHIMAALDAYDAGDFQEAKGHVEQAMEWPENLGQGRPYEPEDRLPRFILGHVEARLGSPDSAEAARALRFQIEAMAEQARTEVDEALIRRALRLGAGNSGHGRGFALPPLKRDRVQFRGKNAPGGGSLLRKDPRVRWLEALPIPLSKRIPLANPPSPKNGCSPTDLEHGKRSFQAVHERDGQLAP